MQVWCTLAFVVCGGCGRCVCVEDGDVEVRVEKDGRGEEQRDDRHRQDHPQALAHRHLQEGRGMVINGNVKIKLDRVAHLFGEHCLLTSIS